LQAAQRREWPRLKNAGALATYIEVSPPVPANAGGVATQPLNKASTSVANYQKLRDAEKAESESISDHEDYAPGTDRLGLIFWYRAHLLELSKSLSNNLTVPEVASLEIPIRNLLSGIEQPTTETDTADIVDLPNEPRSDSEYERTIEVHPHLPRFRFCYLLIMLGALTVAGSLALAIWRS